MKKIVLLSIIISPVIFKAQKYEWAKGFGESGHSEIGYSIKVDANKNIYTTGSFHYTVDFDPGIGTYYLTASLADIFISKLDSNGNFIWAKNIGGIYYDEGEYIYIDKYNNIYITGYFNQTVDFDPNSGIYNLTSNGAIDIFICKLDSNGNFIWAKNFGGVGDDYGSALAIDNNEDIYLTGGFSGTADFNPSIGINNLVSNGSFDIFICKLDSNGNFIWAKNFGDIDYDWSNSIAIDNNDNVYTTGHFKMTSDFDPGTGVFNLSSNGSTDIFISKLNKDGDFIWAKSIGGIDDDAAQSIALDSDGNVYTTGYFSDTVDFNPDTSIYTIASNGFYDIFISKIDSTGDFIWAKSIGGKNFDGANSIILDSVGNVFTSGYFMDTVDFNPGTYTNNLISSGEQDIFISKLNSDGNYLRSQKMGGLSNEDTRSIIVDKDENYYITGFFQGTVNFNPQGADSLTSTGNNWDVFVAKYSLCSNSSSTINIVTCTNYNWNGHIYSESGTYMDTISNLSGCDSIVTLNITINNIDTPTYTISVCDSYDWNGTIYSESGTYIDTFINTKGCDSIVTLNITVNVIDTIVIHNDTSLMANESGANYQWLDCNNSFAIIPGETNQNYSPIINGSYAVKIEKNGCSDTSLCYNIIKIGIYENKFGKNLDIYPNPTNGNITINIGEYLPNAEIIIINPLGQVISKNIYHNLSVINTNITEDKGVYLLKIISASEITTIKILKL